MTTVQNGGGGMKYLDPTRPSPAAEAVIQLIETFDKASLAHVGASIAETLGEGPFLDETSKVAPSWEIEDGGVHRIDGDDHAAVTVDATWSEGESTTLWIDSRPIAPTDAAAAAAAIIRTLAAVTS